MPNKKLPTNIQIFVDHLTVGLEAAGLDFADYHPMTGVNKEKRKVWFLVYTNSLRGRGQYRNNSYCSQ